jgi:hypothetical protein
MIVFENKAANLLLEIVHDEKYPVGPSNSKRVNFRGDMTVTVIIDCRVGITTPISINHPSKEDTI